MKFLPESDDLVELGIFTELFFMAAYGYILFTAANLIGDGSERLLLLYGPGVVGGLVIPILGAIPDGMMIFFSGLGPDKEKVQETIAVGVGTLVGSTVMLITIPFACTIWLGSRKLLDENGLPEETVIPASWRSWSDGIYVQKNLPKSSMIMMFTSLTFLIIQIPAFWYIGSPAERISGEHTPALIGLCVSSLMFIGYSVYQLTSASSSERQAEKEAAARMGAWKRAMKGRFTKTDRVLELIFNKFDKDNTNTIEPHELKDGLESLGLKLERKDLMEIMKKYDVDQTFSISLDEFGHLAQDVFWHNSKSKMNLSLSATSLASNVSQQEPERQHLLDDHGDIITKKANFGSMDVNDTKAEMSRPQVGKNESVEEEVESVFISAAKTAIPTENQLPRMELVEKSDEEEEEEDFLELTDAQLRNKALLLLLFGTALVLIFSDPMVAAMTAFAKTTGIPAFYVSFVITPLASNAAEVIASLRFATKKTVNNVTLSLSSLYGAACMNNTFCLAIFFALIYVQELEWDFTAETIANLVVIFGVGLNGLLPVYYNWQGIGIFALYVISVLLIAFLKFLDK